jgi:hypothetical protein
MPNDAKNASLRKQLQFTVLMSRAITIRIDDADHAALARQADELRIRPGTRMLGS